MRHLVHAFVVLAAVTLAGCGEPAAPRSVIPPPITTPTTPTPQPSATYTLSGVVKEAWIDTGLPGATVTIASGPSRGSTTTDAQGRYTLPNLLPGSYSVTFSKPLPYGSVTYAPVSVVADASFSGSLSLTGGFPVTPVNLQGYWVAQGPYPYEPCWILIFQNGTRLEGWYKDGRDYSTAMSGSRAGDAVSIDVGVSGLRIEGRVEDERCIRGFVRNDSLGGNFPVAISRGGSCSR